MTTATVEDVRELMQLPPEDSTDLGFFHEMAESIVTETIGTKLTEARARLVSINLAAHFALLAIERGGLTRMKTGSSEEEYNSLFGRSDQGFALTRYGQQALALDISGSLYLMAQTKGKAEFRVV